MRNVAWLGLSLDVPRHWEILRHSTSPRKGSLAFADATRQRLQVTWTQCVKAPDVGRLLADHRSRQSQDHPDARFSPVELPGSWRGVQHHLGPDHTLLRAARYDPPTRRLLEIVLAPAASSPPTSSSPRRDLGADPEALASFFLGLQVVGPADLPRLSAFGIQAAWPGGWRLARAQVRPADVTLTLTPVGDDSPTTIETSAKTPRSAFPPAAVTLRRRGLANLWFDGDLLHWLSQQAKLAKVHIEPDSASPDHPRIRTLRGRWDVAGPRYRRLLGRHRVAQARVWHDPDDDAVYSISVRSPARRPVSLEGFGLTRGVAADAGPRPAAADRRKGRP